MNTPQPQTGHGPAFIDASQAAICLGVSKKTVYHWIRTGYLPHHRFGRLVRIRLTDLNAFIDRQHMNSNQSSNDGLAGDRWSRQT